MLNIARLWNGVGAAGLLRVGLALARAYAQRRVAFGSTLSEKPLHADTLATLQAEAEAALHLAFFVAELTGREEAGAIDEAGARLLRLLTPLMKLVTARAAVGVASEVLEAFGGAGYVEDTGLPVILRDGQVLSIWEGTTNVLSLDAQRTASREEGAFASLKAEVESCAQTVRDAKLARTASDAREAIEHAEAWLAETRERSQTTLEAGARGLALTPRRATPPGPPPRPPPGAPPRGRAT